MTASGDLPPAIQELLWERPRVPHNLETLSAGWVEYIRRVQEEAPFATIEDGGETVYTGALSPGCQACKAGEWDCLFLTARCNLACAFCCSPSLRAGSVPLSAFGREVEEVIVNLRRVEPRGISFSGGEVFLDFPRLRVMVERFRGEFPRAHLWTYTNGLLATAAQLEELCRLGLTEIRFNLAATGYIHPGVLSLVEQAARSLPAVTVEIPAIPGDEAKLLAALEPWSRLGVRYLNLHELMYEPGSLSAHLPGPRAPVHT
ncbi:MAG: 4Fe-4S cluster-binding domain-containing protein, partial [Chloroflexi bacterium]